MKAKLLVFSLAPVLAAMLASCGANKKLVEANEGLASNLESERTMVAELQERIGAKDREILVLQVAITVREEELFALRAELDRRRRETKDLQSRIRSGEELERRVLELDASLRGLSEELAGLRSERDALASRLSGVSEEKDEMAREMERSYEGLLASLREEIDLRTVEIQRYRNALTINIMNHIFFDSGKAEIRREGYALLDRIASIVKTLPGKIVRIEGHTDDVPIGTKLKARYPSNWELGAARASAVARCLTETHGIDPSRVVTVSYAFHRPLVPNSSAENRAKNRRIEIVLTDRELNELMRAADGP